MLTVVGPSPEQIALEKERKAKEEAEAKYKILAAEKKRQEEQKARADALARQDEIDRLNEQHKRDQDQLALQQKIEQERRDAFSYENLLKKALADANQHLDDQKHRLDAANLANQQANLKVMQA